MDVATVRGDVGAVAAGPGDELPSSGLAGPIGRPIGKGVDAPLVRSSDGAGALPDGERLLLLAAGADDELPVIAAVSHLEHRQTLGIGRGTLRAPRPLAADVA